MSYYDDIYRKRLNRFGDTPADRLEGARQANFERFLAQSPHYVTFNYEDKLVECVFEPRSQNETKTMMDLLCRVGEHFKIGSIVTIKDERYMIYFWDERRDSGYNRYAVVKITHNISWTAVDGSLQESEAYMYFQEDNMLKNELKSRSRSATLYLENLKLNFLLMPTTDKMTVGDYMEIETTGIMQYFRITGFDIVSTPGIMYVSMDPTYERDLTPAPTPEPGDDENDYYWLGEVNK